MSSEQSPTPAGSGDGAPGRGRPARELTVRRAPKFTPILAAGAVLGVVVAAVVALAGPESAEFTRGAIFGFFAVLFALAGMLAGAVVALVLDRASIRRAGRLYADEVETGDDNGTGQPGTGPAA
jgi:hypothetical protein